MQNALENRAFEVSGFKDDYVTSIWIELKMDFPIKSGTQTILSEPVLADTIEFTRTGTLLTFTQCTYFTHCRGVPCATIRMAATWSRQSRGSCDVIV